MMKPFLIFTFLLLAGFLKGQVPGRSGLSDLLNHIDSSTAIIQINSHFYLASNGLTTHFMTDLRTKQNITPFMKDNNPIDNDNIMGLELGNQTSFTFMRDTALGMDHTGFRFAIADYRFTSLRFSKDLYDLAFYGNNKLAGKVADFSNTRFLQLNYQEFQAGILREMKDENLTYTVGFGISLYKGSALSDLEAQNATLYTAPEGDSINLTAKFSYYTSDLKYNGFGDITGTGFGAHGFFSIFNSNDNTRLTFSTQGLGFIRWKNYSYRAHVDTSFHFEGIIITDVLNLPEEEISSINSDTILNLLNDRADTIKFIRTIPEEATIEFSKERTGLWGRSTIGLSYIFGIRLPLPLFYFSQELNLSPKWNIGAHLMYGGFAGIRGGITIRYIKNEKLIISLGTYDLPGMIFQDLGTSKSLQAKASFAF